MELQQRCSACGGQAEGKQRLASCTACYTAVYCGRECQKSDWPQHRRRCRARLAALDQMMSQWLAPPQLQAYDPALVGALGRGERHTVERTAGAASGGWVVRTTKARLLKNSNTDARDNTHIGWKRDLNLTLHSGQELPGALFDENSIELMHAPSGTRLSFCALDAMRGWALLDHPPPPHYRELLQFRQQQQHEKASRQPRPHEGVGAAASSVAVAPMTAALLAGSHEWDYTFSTAYCGRTDTAPLGHGLPAHPDPLQLDSLYPRPAVDLARGKSQLRPALCKCVNGRAPLLCSSSPPATSLSSTTHPKTLNPSGVGLAVSISPAEAGHVPSSVGGNRQQFSGAPIWRQVVDGGKKREGCEHILELLRKDPAAAAVAAAGADNATVADATPDGSSDCGWSDTVHLWLDNLDPHSLSFLRVSVVVAASFWAVQLRCFVRVNGVMARVIDTTLTCVFAEQPPHDAACTTDNGRVDTTNISDTQHRGLVVHRVRTWREGSWAQLCDIDADDMSKVNAHMDMQGLEDRVAAKRLPLLPGRPPVHEILVLPSTKLSPDGVSEEGRNNVDASTAPRGAKGGAVALQEHAHSGATNDDAGSNGEGDEWIWCRPLRCELLAISSADRPIILDGDVATATAIVVSSHPSEADDSMVVEAIAVFDGRDDYDGTTNVHISSGTDTDIAVAAAHGGSGKRRSGPTKWRRSAPAGRQILSLALAPMPPAQRYSRPDGARLIALGDDRGGVHLWNASTGDSLACFGVVLPPMLLLLPSSAAVSPNISLAAGDTGSTARGAGQTSRQWVAHLCWSVDGSHLAAAAGRTAVVARVVCQGNSQGETETSAARGGQRVDAMVVSGLLSPRDIVAGNDTGNGRNASANSLARGNGSGAGIGGCSGTVSCLAATQPPPLEPTDTDNIDGDKDKDSGDEGDSRSDSSGATFAVSGYGGISWVHAPNSGANATDALPSPPPTQSLEIGATATLCVAVAPILHCGTTTDKTREAAHAAPQQLMAVGCLDKRLRLFELSLDQPQSTGVALFDEATAAAPEPSMARDWVGFDGPVSQVCWSQPHGKWLAAAGGSVLLVVPRNLPRGEAPIRCLLPPLPSAIATCRRQQHHRTLGTICFCPAWSPSSHAGSGDDGGATESLLAALECPTGCVHLYAVAEKQLLSHGIPRHCAPLLSSVAPPGIRIRRDPLLSAHHEHSTSAAAGCTSTLFNLAFALAAPRVSSSRREAVALDAGDVAACFPALALVVSYGDWTAAVPVSPRLLRHALA